MTNLDFFFLPSQGETALPLHGHPAGCAYPALPPLSQETLLTYRCPALRCGFLGTLWRRQAGFWCSEDALLNIRQMFDGWQRACTTGHCVTACSDHPCPCPRHTQTVQCQGWEGPCTPLNSIAQMGILRHREALSSQAALLSPSAKHPAWKVFRVNTGILSTSLHRK